MAAPCRGRASVVGGWGTCKAIRRIGGIGHEKNCCEQRPKQGIDGGNFFLHNDEVLVFVMYHLGQGKPVVLNYVGIRGKQSDGTKIPIFLISFEHNYALCQPSVLFPTSYLRPRIEGLVKNLLVTSLRCIEGGGGGQKIIHQFQLSSIFVPPQKITSIGPVGLPRRRYFYHLFFEGFSFFFYPV